MSLDLFLPPVRDWFKSTFGTPTPVQEQGWPAIAAGDNTLLLAPTGSGKTLAAFLACLDQLWRQPMLERKVHILYVSPLKALNNDIFRNLDVPLRGVTEAAQRLGHRLPRIEIGLRTGDTPPAERQRLVRKPPHVLITTPESLHLLLTSQARETLRGITHCIIDEIHALCPNKRGVFLSLLMERLEALRPAPLATFVRIGLSATQRPLDEVARYLGGGVLDKDGKYEPRPVRIVDAGVRKNLDLGIVSPVRQFGAIPEKTVWPSIYALLADLIRRHRSTIIFANNRRSVERLTAQLQEVLTFGSQAKIDSNLVFPHPLTPPSPPEYRGRGSREESLAETADQVLAEPADEIEEVPSVRAHHGSVALEVRRETEQALKEGRLRAVVATASLELGIDMGAVDLVCQVESPGNVSRALQRVGRAGHIVGQSSKGRLIPKTLPDLVDLAVLTAEMAAGRVEELRVPVNCLDVLAQQIIAMVAMESWSVPDIFRTVRRAYPYRDLTPAALDSVLEMIAGRYRFDQPPRHADDENAKVRLRPDQKLSALQPRISWDRIHERLHPLPGSQRLAVTQGGTIPDTGQYAVYTGRGLRIGELDEEFVYERRVGDAFLLGTSAWRITKIDVDRVLVESASGQPALVPFWRGESGGRSYELGVAQARFLGELVRRLDEPDCLDWLRRDYHLDDAAASNLRDYVRRQAARTKQVPDEKTLVVEAARDPLGDWQIVLHSPLGNRFNLTLCLALENLLRRRLGYRPQCLHHDDGVIIRLTESDEPVLDLFNGLSVDNVRELILEELADSALFALRFRQNAARAMMMPRAGASRRAPLWLQRMRGRDLLQVARQYPDFPVVVETYRECLHDHLDVPRVERLLTDMAEGKIVVHSCRLDVPSPFAASLWFAFNMANMYEYDKVEGEAGNTFTQLDQSLLDQIIGGGAGGMALDRRAVVQLHQRLRNVGRPPRTVPEMAEWLRRIGDLGPEELEGPMDAHLAQLVEDGRAVSFEFGAETRWILREEEERYQAAFDPARQADVEHEAACAEILNRYLHTHALVSLADVLERYPLDAGWARRKLEEWGRSGLAVVVPFSQDAVSVQWSAPENFEQIQRGTLALLRREIVACTPAQFADFQTRWQGLQGERQGQGVAGLGETLHRLHGLFLPAEAWEQAILPARVRDYQSHLLDEEVSTGGWIWTGRGGEELGPGDVAFFARESLPLQPPPPGAATGSDDHASAQVLQTLRERGALFVTDLAQDLHITPGQVRIALWKLVRLGLVSNDQPEVMRRGEVRDVAEEAPAFRTHSQMRAFLKSTTRRRPQSERPEGRWFIVPWARPDAETQAVLQASVLLQRHGIVARELAMMDERMPAWRVLYEVFSRMEMAGEARRGYFVEGLSGAQFALPEAVRDLQGLLGPTRPVGPPLLLHSQDPANLHGSRAPFEMPWTQEEPRPFVRRPGNWLVVQAGEPVLLIEQNGKRLTANPHARQDALAQAVMLLPGILSKNQLRDLRHKLTVETWNEAAVTSSPARPLLESAGFVRDYQAMTWYAAWQ